MGENNVQGEGPSRTRTLSASSEKTDSLGEQARPIDPALENKVRRKIDLFLMPTMLIGMFSDVKNVHLTDLL